MIKDKFKTALREAMIVCLCQRSNSEKLTKFIKEKMSYERMLNICFNPDADVIDIPEARLEYAAKSLIESFVKSEKDKSLDQLCKLENLVNHTIVDGIIEDNYKEMKTEQIIKWCGTPLALECVSMYIYNVLRTRLPHEDAKGLTLKTFSDGISDFEEMTGNKIFHTDETKCSDHFKK